MTQNNIKDNRLSILMEASPSLRVLLESIIVSAVAHTCMIPTRRWGTFESGYPSTLTLPPSTTLTRKQWVSLGLFSSVTETRQAPAYTEVQGSGLSVSLSVLSSPISPSPWLFPYLTGLYVYYSLTFTFPFAYKSLPSYLTLTPSFLPPPFPSANLLLCSTL